MFEHWLFGIGSNMITIPLHKNTYLLNIKYNDIMSTLIVRVMFATKMQSKWYNLKYINNSYEK